jgi:hypothetical protein
MPKSDSASQLIDARIKGDEVDEKAFEALIRDAVALTTR